MTSRAVVTALMFALTLGTLAGADRSNKEELKLKLPKPMFIGTPTNIKSPNLEAITGSRAGRSTCRRAPCCCREEAGDVERLEPGHRRARHGHRRREGGR
jgi:hypothetical protein